MELATPSIHKQGNSLYVQHGDDRGLFVTFEQKPILDDEKSLIEGRPIYKDVDFVTIRVVGDNTRVVERPVRFEPTGRDPSDLDRFPRQWAAYKNKQANPIVGTPITEWPPISKSMAMELKALNIHTIEALAELSDQNLRTGFRDLRTKAQAWLKNAKDNSSYLALQEENEKLRRDMEALKNQVENLAKKPKKGVVDA